MKRITFLIIAVFAVLQVSAKQPFKLAVAGVTHDHIAVLLSAVKSCDVEVIGVYEKDERYLKENALRGVVADSLFYGDLSKMLDITKPEAVVCYSSIYDHMEIVEQCAPRHIHVMLEKPLAVSVEHAKKMKELAEQYGIHILSNYVTSWFPSNHLIKNLSGEIGDIFKMEFYDGHRGPIEIGCSKQFTDWLGDPVLNGGGAIVDFGCYGANLATWILGGQEPIDVYAVLQHKKPNVYPKVDDDATIILRYPEMTVQLMASWCWPFDRLEVHMYGMSGAIHLTDPKSVVKNGETVNAPALEAPYDNNFSYFKSVIDGKIKVENSDLASLYNNLTVVRILDAARRSAESGKAEKL